MSRRRGRPPQGLGAKGWAFTVAALLAVGCASTGERSEPKTTLERIQAEIEAGQRTNEELAAREAEGAPEDLDEALMPDVGPELPDDDAGELRFDLSVDEAQARAFFMGLVEGTPYNMTVHPRVEGTISLELKDVTVPEVMGLVRRVYGYEFEREGTGYVVLPARLESRIFHVDYLNVTRRGESNTTVSSGDASSGDRDRRSNGERSEDSDEDADERRGGRPSSRIRTGSRSDFWGRLEATVRSLVGSGDGREVVIDPMAGLVVVRAMPGELRDVGAYLQAAQQNLQRQVVLEAKVLEVNLSRANETGIDWAALGSSENVAAAQLSVADGASSVLTADGAFDPRSVTEPGRGENGRFDFGGLFVHAANTDAFAALIRLLDTQGDVQVLSSPRVSTVNNQKAVIKVGTDEFFVTDVDTDSQISTLTASEGLDIELTPFFSGISLDVTPQISREGDITLHVHPAVSEVTDQTKNLVIGGEEQSLPLAFSSVRESDSVVRARDGQVIVIGGLMQDQSTTRRGQSGPLGDLPLFGRLFRQQSRASERSELVILLRPMITETSGDWRDAMEEVSQRVRQQFKEYER